MNTHISAANARVSRKLEVGDPADIVMRLDGAGYIIDASPNAERLGVDFTAQLLMPHIADFAGPEHRQEVARHFLAVMSGECRDPRIEFPVSAPNDAFGDELEIQDAHQEEDDASWYSLELERASNHTSSECAAIGRLCPVELPMAPRSAGPLGASADPFTGLADRRSFVSTLIGSIAMNEAVSIAVFAIDGMRSIYMQYGQGTADEIRWGFARFLETMADAHHILAQIDDERFGVILPDAGPRAAREWADSVLQVFQALAVPASGSKPQFSASAGIARGELSAEWTMRQAELGLVMARAAGGMQTAICRSHSSLANGRSVKLAMDEVVERAVRRLP